MWKAMKLTLENIDLLAVFAEPLALKSIRTSLKIYATSGVETYVTIQSYLGMQEGDKPSIRVYEADEFQETFAFPNGEKTNSFEDITRLSR